jgi:hypothetical protein
MTSAVIALMQESSLPVFEGHFPLWMMSPVANADDLFSGLLSPVIPCFSATHSAAMVSDTGDCGRRCSPCQGRMTILRTSPLVTNLTEVRYFGQKLRVFARMGLWQPGAAPPTAHGRRSDIDLSWQRSTSRNAPFQPWQCCSSFYLAHPGVDPCVARGASHATAGVPFRPSSHGRLNWSSVALIAFGRSAQHQKQEQAQEGSELVAS